MTVSRGTKYRTKEVVRVTEINIPVIEIRIGFEKNCQYDVNLLIKTELRVSTEDPIHIPYLGKEIKCFLF